MKKKDSGHRWSNDELKTLMRLWANKESLEVISGQFGVTRYSVLKQIQRMRKQGIPLERRKLGHISGRSNKPWTQEEVQYLMRRREENATYEEIGTELGRSYNAVCGIINVLRRENIPVKEMGRGCKRQWDPNSLKAFALNFERADIVPIEPLKAAR